MRVYLKWGTQINRAEDIAKSLNGRCIQIERVLGQGWQRIASIPICAWRSLTELLKSKPRLIVTQHTHPFATLIAWAYSLFQKNCNVILDCHNGPLVDSPWIRFPFANINRFLFRRHLTIVHNNRLLERITNDWHIKGDFIVLHDKIPDLETNAGNNPAAGSPLFLVPASWSQDEPLQVVLDAARLRPQYIFKITGSSRKEIRPSSNCILTGYLNKKEYLKLLQQSTSVIALSTRNEVLTRASQEALGATKPLIVSDSDTARSYFADSAIYSRNSGDDLAKSCDEILSRQQVLITQSRTRKQQLNILFEQQTDKLEQLLQSIERA